MLFLDDKSRMELKKPLGPLFPIFEDVLDLIKDYDFIVTVGDVTTNNLLKNGVKPNIGIIDNRIQRSDSESDLSFDMNIVHSTNPAGQITNNLWETIDDTIKKSIKTKEKFIIVVEGEEDLAVLPCAIICPENTLILYGQPNEGVVALNVDETRKKAKEILKNFKED